MTNREQKQQELLDRLVDERGRIRAGRFRRSMAMVAWLFVVVAVLAAIAAIFTGDFMAAHPIWTGTGLLVIVLAGHGLAAGVRGWLRVHDADVLRLRELGRDHRDYALDGWPETRSEDMRHRQRLLDDLDDARSDLRRTRRQLIGSAVAFVLLAGAVAAVIWWADAQLLTVWKVRLLIFGTLAFAASAMDVLVTVLLSRRVGSAKANLLAAQRRHRDTALYDAQPSDDQAVELPSINHRTSAFLAPAAFTLLCLVILAYPNGLPDISATPASSPPDLSTRPTTLAARRTSVPVDSPADIVLSPDGRNAYIANSGPPDRPDADVAVVDLNTLTVSATLQVPPRPLELALTPNGRQLVVGSTGPSAAPAGTLGIVDTATRHLSTIPLQATPNDVAVSPDGRTAWCVINGASGASPGKAVTVDLATATVIDSIPVGVGPAGIAIAADGGRAYVTNFGNNTVSVIDTGTRAVVATVPTAGGPYRLVVDQHRNTVWVADDAESDVHQTITAIDTTTLASTPVDLGPPGPGIGGAGPIGLTPDGNHLFVARYSADSNQHPLFDIVDPDTRRVTDVITMPWPWGIATIPDNHHVLTTSGDLWEIDIP